MPQIEPLYDRFIIHQKLLCDEQIIDEFSNDYICPICLRRFTVSQISDLSLEDAPQASLGGRKIAITCKECNNTSGHNIDIHLANFLKRLDEIDFIEGSNRRIKIMNDKRVINADLEVGPNQELKVLLPKKINNPEWFQEHIANTNEGDIIDITNQHIDLDLKKVSTAILKNAYIILFSQFGYTFLLDKHYDRIRNQILNPIKYIAPDLWTRQSIKVKDGIYLSYDNRYRGFFVVYSCKYKTVRSHKFCCFIPAPLMPYESAYYYFKEYEPNTPIHMQNLSGDFITDIKSIKSIYQWAYSWEMKLKP